VVTVFRADSNLALSPPSETASAGKVILIVVPFPSSLSTSILPPSLRTIVEQILRPRPAPSENESA
jgi:hypothetical protein